MEVKQAIVVAEIDNDSQNIYILSNFWPLRSFWTPTGDAKWITAEMERFL